LIEKVKLMSVELIGDNPDDEWVIQGPNLRELIIVSNFPYGGRTEDLLRLQEG
jgi:1,2-phenylacetyl-CoA epoxidase catalytic subunit